MRQSTTPPPQTPGQLMAALKTLENYRRRGLVLSMLPPGEQSAARALLVGVAYFMDRDAHTGPMLEGAVGRVTGCIDTGRLGEIQAADLNTITRFLGAVLTTRRSA